MKYCKKFSLIGFFLTLLISCADNTRLEYVVEKPQSLAQREYLNDYDVLKAYVDRTKNPAFKLGAGVSVSDFNAKGLMYRLICSNFDEMTAGWEMKHGAIVQKDGSLNLSNVESFIATAKEAGITIYGHTLCWHANQNANYLNGLLKPTVIPGEPGWDVIAKLDFETNDASHYTYNQNAIVSFTAQGEGANGKGRALKITNEQVRTNDWDCQFFVTFSPPMEVGERYELSMDVRSDVPTTFATQAHVVPYQYKHWDFFGSIESTTEWRTFVKQITVSELVAGTGAIAFNLGKTATSYYFDNIKLTKYNPLGSSRPSLDPSIITNTDFENGISGWIGWGNNSTRSLSAKGEGYGGGYAFTFTNPSVTNYWGAQVAYDFSSPLEKGATYQLNFKVRGSIPGTIRAEVQSTSDYSSDSFGTFAISEEWKEYTLTTVITKEDRNRFVISFGDYAGTVYLDDITLCRVNPHGGGQIIEKTPEEKEEIITNELERWISGIMGVSKDYVKAWDVVNEPMSDWPDPSQLKTGIGKTNLAADEFYWQDYLGKDYAVKAIQFARKYGNPDDKLFINDYGLESEDQKKCLGLISYVEYVESKGVKVDGIGTQMHVTCGVTTMEGVRKMFQNLAATGKLIKISELDMGYRIPGTNVNLKTSQLTQEQELEMAGFYKEIVKAYFEIIPVNQQYGITHWSPLDSPEDSSWRPGEPIGLWTRNYERKHTYAGFADGLAGK